MSLRLASEATFRRIVDTVLSASKADDTFISFDDSESSTLRFANNQVAQNVSVREPNVSIRVAFGKKNGSASTNRLDANSLIEALRKAEAIARLAPEDPEYLPPLPKQKYMDIPSFRSSTASATPMDVAKRTQPVIEQCEKNGLVGAGILTNSVSARGVAASSGLFGYNQSTEAEFSLTATADDSSGWTYNSHRDINALDVAARTRRAVDKAIRSKAPRELPAGHYPVILEPAAVAGVLGAVLFALDAKSYYKGDSALAGKLDSQILDPRLRFRTDPSHRDLTGEPFDRSGLATKAMNWVDRGVLKQLYFDRFTAKEHNVDPTPRPSAPILSFAGPTAAGIDELIAETKRAVLITNFWYIRSVDPTDLTITGMTRDGTFLVEDGRIVAGVRNFRFHDSPLRCFASVEAATEPMEAITLERGKMLLPAVRLPDFHLSSVTKF
jgi:predicted Zn-dependent protease